MAKKKKAKNKKKVHRRQSSRPVAAVGAAPATAVPTGNQTPASAAPALATPTPVAATSGSPSAPAARWSYVGSDVRRIGILATGCVLIELILWYLFTYTGLGAAAYGLIK